MPGGWTVADFIAKNAGTPSEVMFTTWVVSHVFQDACQWNEAKIVNSGHDSGAAGHRAGRTEEQNRVNGDEHGH